LFFSATIGGFGQRTSWFGAEVGSAIDADVANQLSPSIEAAAERLLAVANANLSAAGLHMHCKEQAFELTVPLRTLPLDEAALSMLISWPSRSRRDRGSLSSVTCGSAMCRARKG
jgi:hypothetical protein